VGILPQATGGTLFLDEIGDMPISVQVKLLRALEERKVRPLGGTTEVGFDARVIAATNRDLESAIEHGRFREDFYYRLSVLQIALPPLRARGGDILLLAQHFISQFSTQMSKAVDGLSPAAAKKMLSYPWPGNVRELRNCVERAVALTRYDQIAVDDLPDRVKGYESRHVVVAGNNLDELVPLEQVEKNYILRVLEAAGGNKSLAARTLGLNRKTLYRRLVEYGVLDASDAEELEPYGVK
jgi:two-component system response regulator HydG